MEWTFSQQKMLTPTLLQHKMHIFFYLFCRYGQFHSHPPIANFSEAQYTKCGFLTQTKEMERIPHGKPEACVYR